MASSRDSSNTETMSSTDSEEDTTIEEDVEEAEDHDRFFSMTPEERDKEKAKRLRLQRALSVDPRMLLRRNRKRTLSTSASISTIREPIYRTSKGTFYTAGRPPWYDSQGQLKETFVIGICGGSASGKVFLSFPKNDHQNSIL